MAKVDWLAAGDCYSFTSSEGFVNDQKCGVEFVTFSANGKQRPDSLTKYE
jgi:hypothetical protein